MGACASRPPPVAPSPPLPPPSPGPPAAPPRFSPLRSALSPAALAAAAADTAAADADSDRPTFLRDARGKGATAASPTGSAAPTATSGGGSTVGSLEAARAGLLASPSSRRAPARSPLGPPPRAEAAVGDTIAGWRAIAAEVVEAAAKGEGSMVTVRLDDGGDDGDSLPRAGPPSPPPLNSAGHFLLNYEIIHSLGAGAFGAVVAVRRRADGGRYVAKISRTPPSPAAAAATLAEVSTLTALAGCPWVVAVEAAFVEDDGRAVVVMEAAAGGDAAAWLARRPGGAATERDAVAIFAQTVAALAAAHAAGVLHRDVKLSNILVTATSASSPPRVKLADFGLAKHLPRGALATSLAGTPASLAPEVLAGRGAGPPADVWAAGVALYTLVTGGAPYGGDGGGGVGGLATAVLGLPVPRLPPGGSPSAQALLDATLVKDPAARATAAQLLARPEVAAALAGVVAADAAAAAAAAGGAAVATPPVATAAVVLMTSPVVGGGHEEEEDDLAKLVAFRGALLSGG